MVVQSGDEVAGAGIDVVVQSGDEVAGAGSWKEELKELEKALIDKIIFIKIRVCMREGKVMASGSGEEAVRTLRCGGRR